MNKYIELPVKDSEDVYYIPRLNVWDKKEVVMKIVALMTPVLGSGVVAAYEKEKNTAIAYATSTEEDLMDVVEPSIDFNNTFIFLSTQLSDPLVKDIQGMLLQGARYSDKGKVPQSAVESLPLYDPTELYEDEDFTVLLKILKVSFEYNASKPFWKWLEEMGYAEIVGIFQSLIKETLPNLIPKDSEEQLKEPLQG